MAEIRSQGTAITSTVPRSVGQNGIVIAADIGDTLANSETLVKIGGTNEPQQIWITSIYANATTAGMLYFYHEDDATAPWVAFAEGDAKHDYSIYIPVNGVALTDVKIGPISEDLLVCRGTAGAYINTRPSEIGITYEYV